MRNQSYNYEDVFKLYREYMLLKNYSKATINTYLANFRLYHKWCLENNKQAIYEQMTIRDYLLYRVENGARWQTMNSIYSAMRKLFREVLELEWSMRKLSRPKQEKTLPELISREDIAKLLAACRTLKQQAMMVCLYASGVRVGELSAIRLIDIDADRLQIRVRKGKGAKDRYVNIPKELIGYLRAYFRKYQPAEYLFNGRKKGAQISISAVRWAIRKAKAKAGIIKKVSPHTFRHCYATHHLECGTDLVFLQSNLGHKHLRTTIRYIRLCKHRYQHVHHPIADLMGNLTPLPIR